MPRLTFFNLPEHKKQTLLDAAIKEFSRVPLAEASIANIVKAAEIPRGSFYQYFKDKEDLYFYLIKVELKEKRKKYIRMLEKHDGNVFHAFRDMLESFLIKTDDEDAHQFYRNMFLNMNYQTEKMFTDIMNENDVDQQFPELNRLINVDDLNVHNDEEIVVIIRILTLLVTENIIQKFAKDLSNDDVLDKFNVQIELLKRGLVKN